MPKCCDCKNEVPLLYSINRLSAKGVQVSEAVCPACYNAEAKKQGRPERV